MVENKAFWKLHTKLQTFKILNLNSTEGKSITFFKKIEWRQQLI